MKLDRKEILTALETISVAGEGKNMVESGAIQNVITFGDEVVVDVLLSTPALHIKKRAEVDIIKVIHEKVYEKAKVKVNIKVEAPEKPENPNLIRGKQIPGISNIIAVASGKGGVGKSTITANLAVSLAKMGFKVGVLDADIYGPSMPIMFDVENSKPISVEVDGKSKMQPVSSYGVEILSIGFFTKPDQAVIWRGPMAAKALNQMIFDANWGELDFMLIDLPPGTGDIHLSIMQSLPIVINKYVPNKIIQTSTKKNNLPLIDNKFVEEENTAEADRVIGRRNNHPPNRNDRCRAPIPPRR